MVGVSTVSDDGKSVEAVMDQNDDPQIHGDVKTVDVAQILVLLPAVEYVGKAFLRHGCSRRSLAKGEKVAQRSLSGSSSHDAWWVVA